MRRNKKDRTAVADGSGGLSSAFFALANVTSHEHVIEQLTV